MNTMNKPLPKKPESDSSLGRPLLVLIILAALLACALIAMSIYLFDSNAGIPLDSEIVFAFDIN